MVYDQKASIEHIGLFTTKSCYSALTWDLVYNKTIFTFEVLELLYSLVKDSFSAFRQICIQIYILHQTSCVLLSKKLNLRFSFFIRNQETGKHLIRFW